MGSGVFLLNSVDYSFCGFCKKPHFESFVYTFFENLKMLELLSLQSGSVPVMLAVWVVSKCTS